MQHDRFEDVSVIEVYIDNTLIGTVQPGLYSNAAKAAFPTADSSNAGFNKNFDISGYANGNYTVLVKAISSDGTANSQTMTVTKQSSGCPALVTDAAPAGSPVIIPDVEKPDNVLPAINAAKQAANGKITVGVKQIGDTTCSITLFAGDTADTVTTAVASGDVTASMVTKKTMSFQASKVPINKKKVKTLYFRAMKVCPGFKDGLSTVKKMKISTSKGAATAAKAISAIQKKLKVTVSKKKKKKKSRRR